MNEINQHFITSAGIVITLGGVVWGATHLFKKSVGWIGGLVTFVSFLLSCIFGFGYEYVVSTDTGAGKPFVTYLLNGLVLTLMIFGASQVAHVAIKQDERLPPPPPGQDGDTDTAPAAGSGEEGTG